MPLFQKEATVLLRYLAHLKDHCDEALTRFVLFRFIKINVDFTLFYHLKTEVRAKVV